MLKFKAQHGFSQVPLLHDVFVDSQFQLVPFQALFLVAQRNVSIIFTPDGDDPEVIRVPYALSLLCLVGRVVVKLDGSVVVGISVVVSADTGYSLSKRRRFKTLLFHHLYCCLSSV